DVAERAFGAADGAKVGDVMLVVARFIQAPVESRVPAIPFNVRTVPCLGRGSGRNISRRRDGVRGTRFSPEDNPRRRQSKIQRQGQDKRTSQFHTSRLGQVGQAFQSRLVGIRATFQSPVAANRFSKPELSPFSYS